MSRSDELLAAWAGDGACGDAWRPHTKLGHDQRALDTVLAAEHMAPDMMRYHAMPRQVVAELLERSRSTRLRGLARRLGVTGN